MIHKINKLGVTTALVLMAVSIAQGQESSNANSVVFLVDCHHVWQPPFGLDRVGRPLTVEIELQSNDHPGKHLLVGKRDGKNIASQKIEWMGTAKLFISRNGFQPWPDELVLLRVADGKQTEVARQKVDVPQVHGGARAVPDELVNPVDLGAIFVPADWLLLAGGKSGHVDVVVVPNDRDLDDAELSVWFGSKPDGKRTQPVSLKRDRREQFKFRLPDAPKALDRDKLHVALRTNAGKEVWHQDIPAMLVQSPPDLPKFGATALKLRYDAPILVRNHDGSSGTIPYEKGWDDKLDDVVVSLPGGTRFVFWRGSSYVPFWAGKYNTAFTYEWAETRPPPGGFVDCVEPLMDKELRYGRVEIVESTEARVHVRWKYQACDFNYKVFGDSVVEDFYFYPDGFGTRVLSLTSTVGKEYEVTEFIVLTPQGTYPLDVMPKQLVDAVFLDGHKISLDIPLADPAQGKQLEHNNLPPVWRIRLHKHDKRAAIVFTPHETRNPHAIYSPFWDRRQKVTPVYWGSHWPLARGKPTGAGIDDGIHKSPAHNSIMTWGLERRPVPLESKLIDTTDALGQKRKMQFDKYAWLIGQTDDSDTKLLARAKCYAKPAEINVDGGQYTGWNPDRRTHSITAAKKKITISIESAVELANPVFELVNKQGALSSISRDGQTVRPGDYRWDGQTLWLNANVGRTSKIELTFEEPANCPGCSLVFSEDFENGHDRWQTVDDEAWTHREVDGNKVFGINRKHSNYEPKFRSPYNIALIRDVEVADFVLTFRVKSTEDSGGHRDCCVFFNHQDPEHYYYVHLGAHPDPYSGQVMIVDGAPRKSISENKNRTPWDDNWHNVKIVRDTTEGTITVYFDDMEKPHIQAVDKTFGKGRVGLGSFDDLNDFDDVKILGK